MVTAKKSVTFSNAATDAGKVAFDNAALKAFLYTTDISNLTIANVDAIFTNLDAFKTDLDGNN
jgi:hypothetical protein